MNDNSLDISKQEIDSIKPQRVIDYLNSNGWIETRKISDGIASIWSQAKSNREFSLLLPLDREVSDFFMRMKEVLETLAYFENRPAPEILKNLLSTNYLALKKQREILSIKLKFIYEKNKQEGSAKKIGMILTSLQDLFNAIGQSESGKSLSSGKIQQEIINVTELSIIEVFQGSFGIKLGLPSIHEQIDLSGNTLSQRVFINILSLVNYSNENDKQKLKNELVRLKKISASRYRKFLMYLVNSEANFYAEWGSTNPTGGGQAILSFENAINTIEFINKMEVEEPAEYIIHGELISATKHKKSLNSIEIEDFEAKKKYAGKLDIQTNIELTIGRYYSAKIQEISSVNPATAEEKSEYTVIELSLYEKKKKTILT